jgi:hypothetical protein
MTVATEPRSRPARAQAPVKARELMEKLNADANKLNIWVRTEINAPAQRPWFTDTGGETGAGQLAAGGRVAANQLKALPALWRWKEYRPFLDRINEIHRPISRTGKDRRLERGPAGLLIGDNKGRWFWERRP